MSSIATMRKIDAGRLPHFLPNSPITEEFLRKINLETDSGILEKVFINYAFSSLARSLYKLNDLELRSAFADGNPSTVLKNIASSINNTREDDQAARQLLRILGIYTSQNPGRRSEFMNTVRINGKHKFFRRLLS